MPILSHSWGSRENSSSLDPLLWTHLLFFRSLNASEWEIDSVVGFSDAKGGREGGVDSGFVMAALLEKQRAKTWTFSWVSEPYPHLTPWDVIDNNNINEDYHNYWKNIIINIILIMIIMSILFGFPEQCSTSVSFPFDLFWVCLLGFVPTAEQPNMACDL